MVLLPEPDGPHDGGGAPLGRGECHVVEYLPLAIAKGHMGEGHIEPLRSDLPSVLVDEVGVLQFLQPVQY